MIDYFAIALTHILLALAAWRLMGRDDLDADPPIPTQTPAATSVQTAAKGERHG